MLIVGSCNTTDSSRNRYTVYIAMLLVLWSFCHERRIGNAEFSYSTGFTTDAVHSTTRISTLSLSSNGIVMKSIGRRWSATVYTILAMAAMKVDESLL